MAVSTEKFGVTTAGEEVTKYTLSNKKGMSVSVIDFGANVVSIMVPDKNGKVDDIVLGFDDVPGYEVNGCFFGGLIGRHGNRIGDAKFTISGKTYEVQKNDGKNNLHGGTPEFNKVMYKAETTEDSVIFTRVSKDGEQGFPGNLDVKMTYTVTEDNEFILTYDCESDQDTICNLTNHSYFNLAGHDAGDVCDHKVKIKANQITLTTDDLIPMGDMLDLAGTPMDLNELTRVGDNIDSDFGPLKLAGGYDHNYVIDREDNGEVIYIGEAVEEKSGRKMEVYTDLVGVQFYTGNFIVDEAGKNGVHYKRRQGLCFETQFFPNAMNVPSFKSSVLKAGDKYHSVTKYVFGTI